MFPLFEFAKDFGRWIRVNFRVIVDYLGQVIRTTCRDVPGGAIC